MTRRLLRLAGLAAVGLLAQAVTLPLLCRRFEQTRFQPDFHAALRAKAGLLQGAFHLGGTALLVGVLVTLSFPCAADESTQSRRRAARPIVALLLLSLGVWLQWALRGWPSADRVVLIGGMVGLGLGTLLPIVSAMQLVRGGKEGSAGKGARAQIVALYALLGLTWLWSLAFGLVQFLLGVSA